MREDSHRVEICNMCKSKVFGYGGCMGWVSQRRLVVHAPQVCKMLQPQWGCGSDCQRRAMRLAKHTPYSKASGAGPDSSDLQHEAELIRQGQRRTMNEVVPLIMTEEQIT